MVKLLIISFLLFISQTNLSGNTTLPVKYQKLVDQVSSSIKSNFIYQYTCSQFRWHNIRPYPQIPAQACNKSRYRTSKECNLMIREFNGGIKEFSSLIHQYLRKRSDREFILQSYLKSVKNSIGRGISQAQYEGIKNKKTEEFLEKEEKDLKEIITLIMCLEESVKEMEKHRRMEYGA